LLPAVQFANNTRQHNNCSCLSIDAKNVSQVFYYFFIKNAIFNDFNFLNVFLLSSGQNFKSY